MTPEQNTKRGKSRPTKRPDDAARMAKALGHPLRTAIMVELNNRTVSPADLARKLDQPVGNVSYHVRILLELDCIELLDTKPRRGALEHFYRATRRVEVDDEAWESLSPPRRRAFALEWFRTAFADIAHAIDADRLSEPDVHFSLTSVELDDAGWSEIKQRLREVVERALELQAEALTSDTEKRPSRVVLAHFQPAPPATLPGVDPADG